MMQKRMGHRPVVFGRALACLLLPLLLHLGWLQVYIPLHLATEKHFDAEPGGAFLERRAPDQDDEHDDHHPHSAHDHEVDLVVAVPPPEPPPLPVSQTIRLEFSRPAPLALRAARPLETRLRDPPRAA